VSAVELALHLAERGWAVFPIGKNKRPIVDAWDAVATNDADKVRALFRPYPACAVGVACGRASGVFVIDVDNPDAGHPIHDRMDPTLMVQTPRGGFHYYYRMPENGEDDDVLRNTQKAKDCLGYGDVDTRGIGGYVVGPGSTTAAGTYEVICDVEPAPIPTWVLEAMRAYKRPKPAARQIMPASVMDPSRRLERARAYVARMPGAISGSGGHNQAMKVARACATGFGLSESEILEVLHDWNGRCTPAWSDRELAHKAKEAANKPDPKGNATGHMLVSRFDDPLHGMQITGQEAITIDGEIIPAVVDNAKAREFVRLPEPDDDAQWSLLEDVRALGGLCEAFPAWVLAGADYPQPGLTVGATVALGAALGARRWTYERATSAQIVCAVAPTASGKGRPQGALSQVLRDLWPGSIGANDLSSTVSTITRIEEATNYGTGLLLVLDEYGPRLKALFDSRSGHQRDMRALLLTMATIGTGSYVAATSATRGGKDRTITAPALSIFGSSTPAALHDAIGQMAVDDGFMGRHLWCEGLEALPQRQRAAPGSGTIPPALRDAVTACRAQHEAWHKRHPEQGDAATGALLRLYQADEVEDAGGAALLADYAEHCDERRRAPQEGDVPAALLGRCAEQATRVALSLAILRCEWPAWPVVTVDVVECAIRIVEASSWTIARSLRDHKAPTWDDVAGRIAYVENAIRKLADADGWVQRSALLRACQRLDAMGLDQILDRLVQEERLQVQKVATGGRNAIALRLTA
jgi:hypothetical protein